MLISLVIMLSSLSAFADGTKELVLTKDNTISLNEVVDDTSASEVLIKAQQLDSKLKSNEPLYLVLYTPGGSIQAGLELITGLKALNRPVHTVTIFAASMGFQTVQGLGTRYILPFGTLMAHKARGAFQGEFPGQIDSRYAYWLQRLNELDKIAVARSNGKQTEASFRSLYENEHWVDGAKAVSEGLADEVVSVHCDQSLAGTQDDVINFMGFSFGVTTAQCPTISGILGVKVMIQTNQGVMDLDTFLMRGGSLKRLSSYEYDSYSNKSSTFGPQQLPIPVPSVDNLTMEQINTERTRIVKEYTNKKQVVVKE